jgi:2-keto-3-deoxy-L-rhamnonate aldolase RhmA
MERPGDYGHPSIREAIEHVAACARAHGVALALSEKGFTVKELGELGAAMIVNAPAGEYAALLDTLTARLAAARGELA